MDKILLIGEGGRAFSLWRRKMRPFYQKKAAKAHFDIYIIGLGSIYNKGDLLSTACGSPSYAAPEMLSGKKYKGIDIDIWSCGAVLYMMLTGKLAFEDENNIVLFKKIISGRFTFPEFLSRSAKDLIKRMLEINPKKRISICDIKKHPWFNLVPPTENVHNGIDIQPWQPYQHQEPPQQRHGSRAF